MSNDLNQCNFIGRLGKDPESRNTTSGMAVVNASIACGWKSKDKEGTEWVNLVFFDKLAEIVSKYLRKGSKVYVSGRMQTRKWQDKEGRDRYTTEVVCDRMQMLDSKPKTGGETATHTETAASDDAPAGDDGDVPF